MTDSRTVVQQKLEEVRGDRPIVPLQGAQEALHIGMVELPWVEVVPGAEIQLLHVDLAQGLWVSRNRFQPGLEVDRHYHTGSVFGVTHSGSWFYKEYPEVVNRAGSYLLEPAGSVHTLVVPATNTEPTIVWFAIYGANVNVDAAGNVTALVDARMVLDGYRAYCAATGQSCEKLIVIGEAL